MSNQLKPQTSPKREYYRQLDDNNIENRPSSPQQCIIKPNYAILYRKTLILSTNLNQHEMVSNNAYSINDSNFGVPVFQTKKEEPLPQSMVQLRTNQKYCQQRQITDPIQSKYNFQKPEEALQVQGTRNRSPVMKKSSVYIPAVDQQPIESTVVKHEQEKPQTSIQNPSSANPDKQVIGYSHSTQQTAVSYKKKQQPIGQSLTQDPQNDAHNSAKQQNFFINQTTSSLQYVIKNNLIQNLDRNNMQPDTVKSGKSSKQDNQPNQAPSRDDQVINGGFLQLNHEPNAPTCDLPVKQKIPVKQLNKNISQPPSKPNYNSQQYNSSVEPPSKPVDNSANIQKLQQTIVEQERDLQQLRKYNQETAAQIKEQQQAVAQILTILTSCAKVLQDAVNLKAEVEKKGKQSMKSQVSEEELKIKMKKIANTLENGLQFTDMKQADQIEAVFQELFKFAPEPNMIVDGKITDFEDVRGVKVLLAEYAEQFLLPFAAQFDEAKAQINAANAENFAVESLLL